MTEYARVYGGSLYDLAAEEQLTKEIMEEIPVILNLFRENPEYMKLLTEPSIKKDERLKLIEEAFGNQAQRYLVSFMKLLCERGILNEFEGCCTMYKQRFNEDHNIAEAIVTGAAPLKEEQLAALKAKLEKISGKTVEITVKVDPRVLAGLKVELNGNELDGTVAGRLSGIQKKLNETIM